MTVLRLRVSITAGEQGGPPLDGHRASLWFGERTPSGRRVLHDGVVVYEHGDGGVSPGQTVTARVWIFAPDDLGGGIGPGLGFDLVEHDRTTARCEVIEVLARVDEPLPGHPAG